MLWRRRDHRERTYEWQQIQQETLQPERQGGMASDLPLSAYLSQVLIAFTLEFDREFKARRETIGARVPPPSLAMWANIMRFLGEEGVDEHQLLVWSGVLVVHSMVACLERHGWVVVSPGPTDNRTKLIRLTEDGRECQEMWRPLLADIEQRWQAEFGEDEINKLRESLEALVSQLAIELPHYPMFSAYSAWRNSAEPTRSPVDTAIRLPLSVLLSQALIAFTIEFEREIESSKNVSGSLAMHSNVMRFLGEEGLPTRQLPHLSGISKPVINISLNVLEQHGQLVVELDPTDSRTKLVRLTQQGRETRDAGRRLLADIEQRWKAQFSKDTINHLRESLEAVVGQLAIELPHYPMAMSHRGGTPTGS